MEKRAKNAKKRVEPRKLKDLVFDPTNARRHPARNLQMIGDAIDRVGAGRSIVIDDAGKILAGEGVVREALKRGLRLRVVDTDGKTLIAVRRSGLTEQQKTDLALADNRPGELAEWDAEQIRKLMEDQWDLSPFFNADELAILLMPDDLPEAIEVDESIAGDVAFATCPQCQHRFPV